MHFALASIAFVLLVAGWAARKRRRVHVPLVLAGILLDLGIVVALEVQRSVIAQVRTEPMGTGETWHVVASVVAVVLYLPTLALGARLLLGGPAPRVRLWHRWIASTALVARTVGFAFMWTVPVSG